jgi:hypothetical protein
MGRDGNHDPQSQWGEEPDSGNWLAQVLSVLLCLGLVATGYGLGVGRDGNVRLAGVGGGTAALYSAVEAVAPYQQIPPTAFVGVDVIPMDSERVLTGQTVVVVNGLITEVGSADEVSIPEGARVVEGEGRFLMPGLAEMHAHVPPGSRPAPGVLEDILFLYLANGITSIRGMLGSPYQLGLRDELASGSMLGPTLYVAAPSLNGNTVPDDDAAEDSVRHYASQGYDLLKIHPGIKRDVWDELTRTAEEEGISFGGHVPAEVGLFRALATGQSTVDHLDGFVEAAMSREVQARMQSGENVPLGEALATVTEESIRGVVDRAAEAGVWVVPTSYLWQNLYSPVSVDSMLALPEMRYVSQAQRDAWRRQKTGRPSESTEDARRLTEIRNQVLAEANRRGVGILMGTDSPQLFNVPGFALHREIRVMEEAGMTPFDILKSGTRNVATYVRQVLRLDSNFGLVARGYRADLILLEGNPLEDLDALSAPAGVMVRGRWLSGEDIRAGLEALAGRPAT